MRHESLSEQLDAHLENRERLGFAKEVERETRADVLREVREVVEALNTTVPVGYTMTPRAMTIGEFRAEVMRAIDKLDSKEKADG